MKDLSAFLTLWHFLLYSIPAASVQEFITLTSSPRDLSTVYPDQPLVFNCSTGGTPILTWRSDDYIGTGGVRLEFLTMHSQGTMLTAKHGAYAVLTVVSSDPLRLESTFHVNASTQFPRPTVTCNAVGINQTKSISFNVSNIPSVTLNSTLDRNQVACPGDVVRVTCTTLASPILAWNSEVYIGEGGVQIEFLSINPVGTVKLSTANSLTSAVLNSSSSSDEGLDVLVSTLTLTVVMDTSGRGQTVTCSNVGVATRASLTIRVADNCAETTTATTPVTDSTTSERVTMTSSEESPTTNSSSSVGLTQFHQCMTIIVVTALLNSMLW